MRKKLIVIGLPLLLIIAAGTYAVLQDQNTFLSHLDYLLHPDHQYSGTIEQFHSTVDRDGDGIDDQQDILEGALEYIATKPEYKSKYYSTGYPDDGYGVCTDVVAYALKSAGYDLMQLINEDIHENPKEYNISEIDINVDFRRVKNQKVYFSRHAVSLTTDLSEIEEWQGGDIVVFTNHIGIVSDRRNADGVPYVIHHNHAGQVHYEQDILEKRNDIAGHYRISE